MADESQINTDAIIVVGDKVDLVIQTGQVYRAMIEDRLENGPFLLAIPSLKGLPMIVHQDDDIYLVFYRESGRYIAHMKVIGLETRGAIRYMWLLQKTLAQKNQRREAYRLPVSFGVHIFDSDEIVKVKATEGEDAEEAETEGERADDTADESRAVALETANSRDLSITGIALITKKQYSVSDKKYTLEMHLKSTPARVSRTPVKVIPLQLTASVKRCIPWRVTGKYDTGMQFIDVSRNMSEEIAKFVLTEQQRQIKMRRLGL